MDMLAQYQTNLHNTKITHTKDSTELPVIIKLHVIVTLKFYPPTQQ